MRLESHAGHREWLQGRVVDARLFHLFGETEM
jgi:hypothetical protein